VVKTLAENGHTVAFHDLYTEHFDPVLPYAEIPRDAPLDPVIARHCSEIATADGIVIVHPDWWGQPPAILKGWIDRVIRPGIAYRFREGDNGEGIPKGLLAAKAALVFNTANTPAEREREVFGDPLERLWKDCIFSFCGDTGCSPAHVCRGCDKYGRGTCRLARGGGSPHPSILSLNEKSTAAFFILKSPC